MKKIMRRQFVPSSYHMRNRVVPSSYHNEFFGRFCKLQQGSQSVMEYHKEFLYLMDKANIKRSPEDLMDRFLFGLREELADTVQRYRYTTMDDLVKLASDWEQVQQMIDRHNKRISSTPIFHSSSKPEMEEFVEYAVEGDVSLEDSTMQNISTGSLGCEQFEEYERKEIEKEIECLSEKNPCLIESERFERKVENSEREESMSEKETEFNKHTCERDLESSSLDKSALVSLKSTESLVSHTSNHEISSAFISTFPGFVNSLVNYGGITMDEQDERQIAHFGQDGEIMVGKIELAHMRDIATIQWIEKSHQTMVFEPGDWVWIPWRNEEHLIQDSRTNLFEEGENDTCSGGLFRHFGVKGQNGNLVIFKDLNTRRIIPCRSWTSRRPRVRLKNSGAERATTHKAQ